MVPGWVLLLVSLGYAALLFGVAWYGDRRPLSPDRPWLRTAVYSLGMAVYCSSWTFYGAVGTAARESVVLAVPDLDGLPVAVLGINLAGALLLGLLLEALLGSGPDAGRHRSLRLLLGTGFCGGFTTYSALATATAVLLLDRRSSEALLYAAATLVVGALATWAGIALGAVAARRAR